MASNLLGLKSAHGHIDSSFGDERWLQVDEADPRSRIFLWRLGEDEDGPVAICTADPPNPEGKTSPSHSHDCDTLRIIVSGSMKIGNDWYRAGDIRMQERGRIYGPELVGLEGCCQVVFFANAHGRFPDIIDPVERARWQASLDDMRARAEQKRSDASAGSA